MSTAQPINKHRALGARIGRTYEAKDARAVGLGLQPPPNRVQGFDAFTNIAARMGFGTPSLTEATQYNMVRWTYDYWLMITLYRNHWISRRIVDTPAQDMVRAWPRLTSDIDPADLTSIDRTIRRTNTKQQLMTTLKWARLFGGAGALIVIKGHENRLDEPLDYETIEPGAYKGLIPFDRWSGIYPEGSICNDIESPLLFNLPEKYRVQTPEGGNGFTVHASRILRFNGPSVPAPEYQAQQYWGISCLEPAFEEIRKRDNMSWNILSLSFRASIIGMRFNDLAQALSGAGMNQNALVAFQSRMESINQLMSNQSMLMLPEGGGLEQISVQAAGWDGIYQQFQLDIAGAADIPVSRLFGRTISGLGQANDMDERVYEEKIAVEQEDQLRPQLDRLYPILAMSCFGEIPKDLDLVFPSVRVLNDEEKANLSQIATNNINTLVNAGILTKAQALKELKQSSDVTGFGTNITDEDIEAAEKAGDMTGELLGPDAPEDETDATEGAEAAKPGLFGGTADSADSVDTPSPLFRKLVARAKDSEGVPDEYDVAGIPVKIEFRRGSRRQIRNQDNQIVYDRLMKHHYGFIRNTVGRDGDEIDCIIGSTLNAPMVYVVDMEDLGPEVAAREDEDKVLIGFNSPEEAEQAFVSMYDSDFLRSIVSMPVAEFRELILTGEPVTLTPPAEMDMPEPVGPVADKAKRKTPRKRKAGRMKKK